MAVAKLFVKYGGKRDKIWS